MPTSYTEAYFPVLVQAILAMVLAAGLLTVSRLLGKRVRNRVKDMPYESGIVPTGASMFSPHFLQRIVKSHCRVCGRLNTIVSIGEQKTKVQCGFRLGQTQSR